MKQLTLKNLKIAGVILSSTLIAGGTLSGTALAAPTQTSKLTAPEGAAREYFGYSVLRSEGDLFVGAHRRSSNNGALFAYFGDLSGQTAPQEFVPPEGRGNYFGASVVRQGDTLIIGAQRSNAAASGGGAAYVYKKDDKGSWTLVQTLTADNAASNDYFSQSMAISGDTLWIGAPRRDVNGQRDAGAVYVFTRQDNGQWTQTGFFISATPAVSDQLGSSVAVRDGYALVGAPGVDSGQVNNAGVVWAFARNEQGVWVKQQDIVPATLTARAGFGTSVAMHAHGAVVGAPGDSVATPKGGAGAVYCIKQEEGAWAPAQTLTPKDTPTQGLQFGFRVSASPNGEYLVVGAPGATQPGFSAGKAYSYSRAQDGSWGEAQAVQPEDVAARDLVGSAVSVGNDGVFALGVRGDDDKGSFSGSAYVFSTEPIPAPVAPLGVLLFAAAGLWGLRRRSL